MEEQLRAIDYEIRQNQDKISHLTSRRLAIQLSNAYAVLKICTSKGTATKKGQAWYQQCIRDLETDGVIGINYNITKDLTHFSLDDIKHELITHCDQCVGDKQGQSRKNPRAQTQIKAFIDMPIGSTIIVGLGLDKALYLATIASDYEYNTSYGMPHIRKISNLIRLPEGMKTGIKTQNTFKRL